MKKNTDKWDWVIHKRIAKYFRLYTQILNFSMYMLVSHRNMISIFDMTSTDGHWLQTISFKQGAIRQMLVEKRSKRDRIHLIANKMTLRGGKSQHHSVAQEQVLTMFEKYQIISLIGTHTISYCTLKADGHVRNIRDV